MLTVSARASHRTCFFAALELAGQLAERLQRSRQSLGMQRRAIWLPMFHMVFQSESRRSAGTQTSAGTGCHHADQCHPRERAPATTIYLFFVQAEWKSHTTKNQALGEQQKHTVAELSSGWRQHCKPCRGLIGAANSQTALFFSHIF